MPQLEDGYLKIANELFDALIKAKVPGSELRCALFVIRKTYGYNKKSDWISNSQFVTGTGLEKSNVCRAIRALLLKKILVKDDNQTRPKYRFNKNYWQWELLSKPTTKGQLSKMTPPVVAGDNNGKAENGTGDDHLNPKCSEENGTAEHQGQGIDLKSGLLSPATNTKDSNNVTKERGAAESGEKKQKTKPEQDNSIYIKKLKLIASGRTDHFLVSEYAWEGESFEDMKVRASRELQELERSK